MARHVWLHFRANRCREDTGLEVAMVMGTITKEDGHWKVEEEDDMDEDMDTEDTMHDLEWECI